MSSFITSLSLSLPLLILIALGYFLKKVNLISSGTTLELSKLVLYVLLPINNFISIYDSDFKTAFDIKLIGAIAGINIIATLLSIILVKCVAKDNKEKGAMFQVSVRGNHIIYGLPLVVSICGSASAGKVAIAAGILTAIFSIYAVYVLEYCQSTSTSFGKLILNVIKNPITIGILSAIIVKVLNITLPQVIYDPLTYIAKSTTAIALINIGASYDLTIDKRCIRLLIPSLLWKLIIMPIIGIVSAIALGYTGESLVIIFILCAVPVAIACFPTGSCYDTDLELTKEATIWSHIICTITIPIILTILISLGLV